MKGKYNVRLEYDIFFVFDTMAKNYFTVQKSWVWIAIKEKQAITIVYFSYTTIFFTHFVSACKCV